MTPTVILLFHVVQGKYLTVFVSLRFLHFVKKNTIVYMFALLYNVLFSIRVHMQNKQQLFSWFLKKIIIYNFLP